MPGPPRKGWFSWAPRITSKGLYFLDRYQGPRWRRPTPAPGTAAPSQGFSPMQVRNLRAPDLLAPPMLHEISDLGSTTEGGWADGGEGWRVYRGLIQGTSAAFCGDALAILSLSIVGWVIQPAHGIHLDTQKGFCCFTQSCLNTKHVYFGMLWL